MIKAFQVHYHNKSFIFGNFRYINIDPKFVLFKNIAPMHEIDKDDFIPTRITLRIGKKKRTFRGFFIAEDEYALQKFLIRNGIVKSNEIREIIGERWLFPFDKPYLVEWHGKTYAFSKERSSGILTGWERRDGFIYPVVVGWFERRKGGYFYLHRIEAKRNISQFRFISTPLNIPKTIIEPLKEGFIFNSLRYGEDIIDIIPFAPYDVKYALRIYPPRKVIKAKEEPLPKMFEEPFIIKRFLQVPYGVKVIESSPGVVKTFVKHINGNVFTPSCSNPHWDSDYDGLWRMSAGYILLCKPERFFEEGK